MMELLAGVVIQGLGNVCGQKVGGCTQDHDGGTERSENDFGGQSRIFISAQQFVRQIILGQGTMLERWRELGVCSHRGIRFLG